MPEVRCPCGCRHDVPAEQLGQPIRCRGCGASFVAGSVEVELAAAIEATETAAAEDEPKAPRLGDLAVERALVSREHIELCFEVQQALREAGETGKRIGEILVEKQLISAEQLGELLGEQAHAAGHEAPLPTPAPRPKPPPKPPEKPTEEPAAAKVRRAALRPTTLVLLAVLLLAFTAIQLWPAPAAQRTLARYLRSSREGSLQPDLSLALGDLGLTVRDFRIEKLLAPARHDYAPELKVFRSRRDQGTWQDLLDAVEMPTDKRGALTLVAPILPKPLTPHSAESLTVTVQPVRCYLFAKHKGEQLFREGRCRFTVVRADSRRWSSGWKVAACVPADARLPE